MITNEQKLAALRKHITGLRLYSTDETDQEVPVIAAIIADYEHLPPLVEVLQRYQGFHVAATTGPRADYELWKLREDGAAALAHFTERQGEEDE